MTAPNASESTFHFKVNFTYCFLTCIAKNMYGEDSVTVNFTTIAKKHRDKIPPWGELACELLS